MLNNKTILITGGTGSFGHHFVDYVLKNYEPKKIIIYSRDEFKQFIMDNDYKEYKNILRFFIGDVRDEPRLRMAMNGVDYVIHAAALKQVPALDAKVKKVVALSTDKAVNPVNLYGGTKLVSDKLFTAANSYSGADGTRFAVVRYGNVAGSRGSVIPFFQNIIDNGGKELPITDYRMTRFWISLEEGVELVVKAIAEARGGETFISKIPSFKVTDLAQAMLPGCKMLEVGIREGEKLHEIMVTREDSLHTYEYAKHFIIYPNYNWWGEEDIIPGGELVKPEFEYSSGTNTQWLKVEDIQKLLLTNLDKH